VTLTNIQRELAKTVCQSFYLDRSPVSHEDLLRRFDDPRPIITLVNQRILNVIGASPQRSYLPTILAFQYCGDEALKQNAKNAQGTVIAGLKVLFKETYDSNRQHPAAALESGSPTGSATVANQIAVGLFLAREIPNVFFGIQQGERNTDVVRFIERPSKGWWEG